MKTFLNSIMLLVFLVPSVLLSQNIVTGKVTDNANAMPLPGVSIMIKGTASGVTTDFDGNYTINLKTGDVLVLSYVGYKVHEVTYTGQSPLNVVLMEDNTQLDEIVLIGYGSVRKQDLTGTADLITSKDFNQGPIVSAQQLITGKVAGVSVTSGSGSPGDGQNIVIRGLGSLSLNNGPLIVIDGVPINDGGVGGSRNPLNLINPNDIESMVVLKDASASAIYGSRSANGVIIITTKKGKNRDFQFNYSGSTTLRQPTQFVDVLSAGQFRELVNEYTPTAVNRLGNASTNWQKEIYRDAWGFDHSFSALGSAFGVPMRASFGYSDHDGVLRRDNFQRTTASLNLSPSLFEEHLKLDINVRGSYTENFFPDRGSIGSAIGYDPTQSVYDPTSPYAGYSTWINPATNAKYNLAPTNPMALLNLRDDASEVRRLLGNIKADYKLHFFPDVTATVNVGLDESNAHGRTLVSDLMPTSDPTWNGSRNTYRNVALNRLFDAYLTYSKEIGEHGVSLMAGHSYQEFEFHNNSYDSEAEEDGNTYLFVDKSKNVLLSYFGRLNYDYKDKYLVTATLRADASSKLNPNDRWGYFPSVALAWNIHNESFMQNSKFDQLKLRLGYGEVGNVNGLGDYNFLTRYSGSQDSALYQFGYDGSGLPAFYQTYRPDPESKDLKWEIGRTLNVGLDYSLFNNRVNGSVNAYIKETKDLISNTIVDPFTNFGVTIPKNIGDMENKGIEFTIDWDVFKSEDFTWNIGYNVAFNKNKVTNLPDDQPTGGIEGGTGNRVQINREGEAPYSYYVFKQVYDTNGRPIEGSYVDRNGDGIINDDDKYIYHNPFADVLMGLNTSINYKNWDLQVITRASIGNYAYNNNASKISYRNRIAENSILSNLHSDYLNTGFVALTDANLMSDHYVQEASFFKVDNITLGYTLANAFDKATMRFYGSVQNVATITDYKGLDPEIHFGIDNNFYPRPTTYVFGVSINF